MHVILFCGDHLKHIQRVMQSKHIQRVIQSMTLKGNAGFMEQYFRSFHLQQIKNILKYKDSQTVLGLY